MSWATVRDGMKGLVDNISGLTVSDVFPDNMASDKNYAAVLPGQPVLESEGHGGMTRINIRLHVRCKRATAKDAQDALDAYVWPSGASSVQAAIEADPTLSGAVDGCWFLTVENYDVLAGEPGVFAADVFFRAGVSA